MSAFKDAKAYIDEAKKSLTARESSGVVQAIALFSIAISLDRIADLLDDPEEDVWAPIEDPSGTEEDSGRGSGGVTELVDKELDFSTPVVIDDQSLPVSRNNQADGVFDPDELYSEEDAERFVSQFDPRDNDISPSAEIERLRQLRTRQG